MAVKDHSLDEKIIEAATGEFLEHGFQKASLRQIAKRANLSTGALYTRYENKDVLFCSLVQGALEQIAKEFEPMREIYEAAQESGDPDRLLDAIRKEEEIYLRLMFTYYDQCILFFCRSDGSSVQAKMTALMEHKANETVSYFKRIAKRDVDYDGIAFILSEQFHYYRQILEKGYDKERAVRCMKTVEQFLEAGWRDFFERILGDGEQK